MQNAGIAAYLYLCIFLLNQEQRCRCSSHTYHTPLPATVCDTFSFAYAFYQFKMYTGLPTLRWSRYSPKTIKWKKDLWSILHVCRKDRSIWYFKVILHFLSILCHTKYTNQILTYMWLLHTRYNSLIWV